jgi:hypothetical protein
MASFSDLRPRARSAKAGGGAVRRVRTPLLLAVFAALLLTAFLAVSELATLRGAKAHDASAYLTRELGSPLSTASLVRKPARNHTVTIGKRGFTVSSHGQTIGLASRDVTGGAWRRYQHGVSRTTGFGTEAISVHALRTEQSLVVRVPQGRRTWRWSLDTRLQPRLGPNGTIGFVDRTHRLSELTIAPVKIYDGAGKDVTPDDLAWSLGGTKARPEVELLLDDADLPRPYVIDPIVIRSATAGVGFTSTTSGGAQTANISLTKPSGAAAYDMLIAHVTVEMSGTALTIVPPAGWTLIRQTSNGTNVSVATFWHAVGVSGDAGPYVFTWQNPPGTGINRRSAGGITAYVSVDNVAPIDSSYGATGASRNANVTGISTSGTNRMLVYVEGNAAGRTQNTPPTAMTERYDVANTAAAANADYFSAAQLTNVSTSGQQLSGTGSPLWAAQVVGLVPDTTAPTNSFSLTSVSPAGSAYYSGTGTTIWYHGTGANCAAETQVAGQCSFKIRNTVSDPGSGPASSQFGTLGGTTTGWSFTGSTVSTPTGGPYDSNFLSWTSGTNSSPTEAVIGTDNAGNSNSPGTTLTLTDDSTAPTVSAPSVTAGYYTSLSVPVTKNGGTDGGSGVNAGSSLLERDEATLTGGSCGSFSGSWTTVTLVGGNDTSVSNGKCYQYRERLSDNVGNQGTSSASNIAKVDTTAPSTPTLSFSNLSANAYWDGGSTFYFRPSAGGTFTVTAASSDTQSGVSSYTFGTLNSNGGSNWGGSQTSDHFDYTFNASTTAPSTARTVSATNGAGTNSSDATYSIAADTTAPTGGALTVNGTAASGGGSVSYDTDGSFTIGTRTDYSETASATESGLASSTLVRTSASFSAPDVCGSFGSPTTISGNPDQNGLSTGCYRYTLTGTDNVGNAVSISTTVKVDTSDPAAPTFSFAAVGGGAYYPGSGTRVYFKPDATTGTFDITASSSDGDTDIASYTFPAGSALGTNWSGSGSGATRTYSYTATATTNGSQSVSATNNAGRSNSSSFDLTADATAPTGGALTVNGGSAYSSTGNFPIDVRTDYGETQSATASGLLSSTLVRTSASYSAPDVCGAFGSPSTIVGNPDQTGLATGCYRYTLTGTDNVGNTVSITTTVKVDTTDPSAPSLSFSNVGGGAYYPGSGTRVYFKPDAATGTFDISASSSDSDTGVASYGFPAGSALGTNWSASGSGGSRTYSYTATATSNGSQSVTATNNAGRSNSAGFDLTADSTAPTGGALTVNGGAAYSSTGNFPINVRTDYSEAQSATQSGLASSTLVRTSAGFSAPDVCGSFGSPTTISGNPDQNGLSTGCWRYTLTGTDNVGNSVSISTTVKVDTSDPATPALTLSNASGGAYYPGSGTRVYFKPDAANGAFDISAGSSDDDSGIASYTFPTGATLGTNWSASGSGSSRTYSYTATATTNGTQSVSATNAAGRSASSTFDLTDDSTAPTGGALTVNGTAASGGGGASYDTDGSFTIGTRTDYSETQSATASGLLSSTLVRSSASYSSPDVCGSFGSPTTIVGNPDQTGLTTGCWRYTLTGTDNVGNTVFITTTVKVDTSDPSAPTFTFSNFVGSTSAVGNVVLFLPTGSGSFDITASSTDGDSGIGSYTFPSPASFGSGWSVSGSGNTRTYSYVAGAATPGAQTVTAANNAGLTASANFSVVVSDTTAPTTSIQCNGAACQGTYYTSAPVSVTLSADDGAGGSGVDVIRYTLDGTDPTPVNGSDYVAPIDIFTTATVKFRAYDNLGNEEAVGSQLVRVDGTPPTLSLSLSEQPASGAQHIAGTTLYYRPGASGGTLRVSATTDDPQTGVSSVDFPAVAGVSGGSSQTTAPYREDYTWNASTTDATSHNVVATNGAGSTTSAPFTLTQDSSAPSGQTLTLTGADAPYYGSASVTFTTGDGNDGSGSGIDTASRTVTRETGDLVGDVCSSFSADAGTFTSPDTAVSGGHCYRYTFTVADNVGNVSSAVTATAKVDTQAPNISVDAPTELSGGGSQYYNAGSKTLFFRSTSSGSFRLNSSSSDAHTAVTTVTYPDLSGVSGWSTSVTDSSWSSGAAAPGARNVSATDKASNSASDSITVADDTTAPTGQAITLTGATAPYFNTASVTFSLGDGNDGSGAGIDTATRTVTRETGDLSAGSCSNFSADAGTFTSPDTAVSGGHCYRYTFTIADNVGNVSSAVTATAKVDTNAPSVSVTAPVEVTGAENQYYDAGSQTQFFRPGGSGSFTLNATSSDPDSGIDHLAFPDVSGVSGWSGSTGGSDSSSPYSSPVDYAWSSGAGAPGLRSVTATNGAAIDASAGITLAADASAPSGQSITLTGANAPYYASTSVTFTLGDGNDGSGAGVDTSTRTVTRETGDLAGDSCSNFSADAGTFTSPDTAVSGARCYRYTFTIADRVGNVSSGVTAVAKVDTTGPSVSLVDPGSPVNGTVRLSATASDSETSVAQVVFQWSPAGAGSWTTIGTDPTSPYTADWNTAPLSDGMYDVRAVATDVLDNAGSSVVANRRVDHTAPDTTIDSSPASPSNDTTPTFSFSSSESGSTFDCRVDGGSWSSCSSPHTVSPALGEGSHTFDVRATDQAGNTDASPASYTWTVDLTAPQTTIDSGPASPSTDTTPTFSFSSSESGSSFQCRVDGGSWSSCTSPHTTAALAEGTHTFDVRATDQAGNTDPSPASNSFEIDLTAPTTTIDSGPNDPSNDTTPTFTFSASEPGSTYECRVDGGSWSSCTSPHTTAALGAGSHTFDVRATDAAGNTDATPASSAWTIDLTAPDTTIDSAPPAISNNATPTFTFSSSESGSTFECRMDGASWSPCSSPHTVSPALGEGSHTFDVRATDAAGNTDTTPAGHTWSIDLGAPTVTITAPTTYINGSDPATYTVTASTPSPDVARVDFYECSNSSANCSTGSWTQFDTDNSAPYAGSWSTPGADGTRAIRAVAVDVASNTGEHVRNITIDRTAPTNVTVSYPNSYVFGSFTITTSNGSDPDIDGSSAVLERQTGDLANDSCSGYGGWTSASSPDTLASGKCAKYRYRVADNAGNWTIATSSNEAKSDTAEPSSSHNDPGANLRQTVTLSASASDTGGSGLASVAFQRRPAGGGSWTTIATDTTSPYSTAFDTTTVADGLYDFRSVATDVAGNTESAPAVVPNRRIDNTAPSATMTSPGNPVRGTVTLTSSTSDSGSGLASVAYDLAPNGGSFNSQAATWDTTLNADGLYDLRVTATDVAGNSTTSAAITTRVDNTAPALTFSSPASGAIVSGTVSLTASASDASPANPPVTFAYKLHSDPPSAYTATGASWNTTSLPAGDGLYDLRARATDDANNTTTIENTNIRVDNQPPSVAITAPPTAINGSLPSPTTFSATASDPSGSGVAQVQFFECSNQSSDCSTGVWSPLGTVAAPGPYSVSWNIPATDGNHALAAVATDNAGHPSSAIRNVDVDRTAPDTTITGKPADPSNAVTPTFTFSSSEPSSTFECRIDGGVFTSCTSPHNVTGLTDNDHTFEVRATDAAGNTDATPDSWTWHRDTNAPTGSLDNPGANIRQVVTLTSTESDPPADGYASGLASVSYEYSSDGSSWALIGTNNSAPFDSFLWNTASVLDGVYQLRIVVRDVAGNVANSAVVTNVRVDNTPPTTSQDDPGQYLRATKALTGSAADSGSGIDHVDFQRAPTGGGAWTTIASDATSPYGVSFDTTTVADGHYDFRTVAYDVAGNQAAATPVTDRLVDNTLPDATLNDPGTYLRGPVSLTSTTSDPGGANASGVVSVAYEYSTNGGGTWQPTGSTFDSTAVADGNVDLHVIATDAAGNSRTSAALTRLVDNTKPATTDNAPAGWQASDVTVTLTANDAGSGVNVTEYSVDGNPSYTVGTSVAIPAPADGSNDGAHTIAYFSVDNAGNIETVKSTTVLIDATPPACPSCSAADYLRGTVTLSAGPDTGGSGIQSVAFEYTDAGGSTWTLIGTDNTGPAPYTAAWDTTAVADGHYDLRMLVTDNAGNVSTTNLPDKVVDNTAPDTATVGAPTEGQLVTGTIAIAASASDVTSPIASVQFIVRGSLLGTDTTAPYSMNWNTTTGPDGAATIQVIVSDMAGNTTSSPVRNVTVDNVSPTPSLADPGEYVSGTISLSASSDPDTTQVDFERRPAGGGSWVTIASDSTLPWGTSLDTTTLADGLYDFRVVATDQGGNTGTSAIRSNVRVDNTAPSGSLTAPTAGATIGGSNVQLSASVSDGGSGVGSVRYELRPTGGGAFSQIATSSSAPFSATWDATTVATGSYDLRPVITDRAGNTFTGAVVTFDVDVTAPTVTLTNPGASISGVVSLNATVSGSGAAQVSFGATPAGGSSWTSLGTDTSSPWSLVYDTTKLADGLYDVRAIVTDTYGNSSSDVVAGIRIDNTAPRVVSSTPAEGSTVTSASSIELVTSEAVTPVGVTLDGSPTVPPVIAGTSITYGTGALGAGPHTLAGELQDSAGKRAPFRLHFTVYPPSSSSVPYVEKNTSSGAATTVGSADGFASATMPAGAWSSSSGDWIVLRIAATAVPSGLTNGFAPGPEAMDVTAWWALAGTQVHQLSQPIDILIRSTERGLVPATFENGSWRIIHRVPTGGVLPAGWEDGFYTDGSGFHVLTKHLSLFALLRDLEAPQPPQNVRGYAGPDGLTIRWLPGADNSGTYDFVTVYSHSNDVGHYDADYTAATIAGWHIGDSRVIRLMETDLAGNESTLAEPLLPVPSLVGLTREQAAAALRARGFTIGSISVGGSGRPGTVTGPEGLVLAEQGAAIDLVVADGAGTSLVFKVVTAPKLKPSPRKRLAARVTLTRAAHVTAELYSPRKVKLFTWRLSLKAGRTIVKLKIPRQVRRTGVYSMRWRARAGRETVSRLLNIRIVGTGAKPTQPVEVVLAGRAAHDVGGKLGKKNARLVSATGAETTFDAAANRRTDVRVIVIDADEFGIALIRELHAVFPSVKIIALASGPRTMAAALKAGASVVLPRSTPPTTLSKVINRLLKKR